MKFVNTLPMTLLAASIAFTANAQEDNYLDKATQKATAINQSAVASQQKINTVTSDIESKLQQFKSINKEIAGLQVYNGQLDKQIANQVAEMAQLNSAIDEVSVIERQITPLMMRMIDGLAQFVALDVPFLPQERVERIEKLRAMMDRADVSSSEKFRRVLEAYQVEVRYGRDVEAYSGLHSIAGVEREVDFLRIGRTALVYQTRDGNLQGAWNKVTKQWDALDTSYRSHITKGLRMARKQLAPDLLMLPIAITDK